MLLLKTLEDKGHALCGIQVGVRTELTYENEGLFATESIQESLNAKMSGP